MDQRLFFRHYPRLVRYLYRRLGDRDEAEDLAQEAFVRLWRHRPRRPEPWLYAVAANLARDAARGDARRKRRLRVWAPSRAAEPLPDGDPVREEAAQVQAAQVRAALASLSERDATLLLLRAEGCSYREIAGALGVAPSSVGPLLVRAQRRFLRSYDGGAAERRDGATYARERDTASG